MARTIGVFISHGFYFHFRLLAIFRSSSKFIKCVSPILIDSPIGAFFALFYSFDSIVEILKMLHVADDDDEVMLMLHANSIWGFFSKIVYSNFDEIQNSLTLKLCCNIKTKFVIIP